MQASFLAALLGLCTVLAEAKRPFLFPHRGGLSFGRNGIHPHGHLASRDLQLGAQQGQNLVVTSYTDPITLYYAYGPTVIFLFGDSLNATASTSSNTTQFVTGAVIPDPSQVNATQTIIGEAVAQAKQNGVVLAVAMAQANATAATDLGLTLLVQLSTALAPPPIPAAYAILNYAGSPTLLSNFTASPGRYSIDVQNSLSGKYGVNP